MIFAREVSDSLTSLVKKIDAATVKYEKLEMGSFVVFCNNDDGLKDKLKKLAEKEGLKELILSIFPPEGPEKYKIAKEADITVILYDERVVKANYAFKKPINRLAGCRAFPARIRRHRCSTNVSKPRCCR
jgi:hypothetical protein